MQVSRNALSRHFEHVYLVREGARGANGVQGAAVAATKSLRAVALLGTAGRRRGWRRDPARRPGRGHGPCLRGRWPARHRPGRAGAQEAGHGGVVQGSIYVDRVSSASIDVVTTASPFKETRGEFSVGATTSTATARSRSPPRKAPSPTTRPARSALTWHAGHVRQHDDGVAGLLARGRRRGPPRCRLLRQSAPLALPARLTQILSPHWLATLNVEAVADDGYLGNPIARPAWRGLCADPGTTPRTRSSRALKLGTVGALAGAARCARPTATSGTTGPSAPTPSRPATAAMSVRAS